MSRGMTVLFRAMCVVVLMLVAAPARAQAPAIPDGTGILILVRTALVALNHANRTGNYTVLRDLGAPGFRGANDAARLGQIFANLRGRDLDLGPVTVIQPKLEREPVIDERGLLRVAGYFPSRPLQVNFELAWQYVDGRWLLFGIAVNPASAEAKSADGPDQRPRQ